MPLPANSRRPALAHWAYEPDVPQYSLGIAHAEQLVLDAARFPRGANGIRFHLPLKSSVEGQARVFGAALTGAVAQSRH